MNHPQIDEQEVLARYLSGELTLEDEERFEDHLLNCGQCQDGVEADLRFQSALRSLQATDDLPETAPAPSGSAGTLSRPQGPAPPARSQGRLWQPFAWAASVLIALLPAVLLERENRQLQEALEATAPAAASVDLLRLELEEATRPRAHLPLLRLESVRSNADAPYRLSLGDAAEWVILVVEPPEPLSPPYAVTLDDAEGDALWRQDGVDLDAYATLTLSLYSPTLAAGTHRLHAVAADGSRFTTSFDIRR